MLADTIWRVLAIEPTNDAKLIRRAYAQQLKVRSPESDVDAFQELVEARDAALNHAKRPAVVPEPRTAGPVPQPVPVAEPVEVAIEPLTPLRARLAEAARTPLTALPTETGPLDACLNELERLCHPEPRFETTLWRQLIEQSQELSLKQTQAFRRAIAKRFLSQLPPHALATNAPGYETMAQTVTLLSSAYDWARDQRQLLQLVDAATAFKFAEWDAALAAEARRAERAVLILQRGGRPQRDANGMPLIDAEDRALVLVDRPLVDYYDASLRAGRWGWPQHGSWSLVLLPLVALLDAGYEWVAWVLLGAGAYLSIVGLFHPYAAAPFDPYGLGGAIGVIAVASGSVLFHLLAPLFVMPLKLRRALTMVRAADRHRLTDPTARAGFLRRYVPQRQDRDRVQTVWMGVIYSLFSAILVTMAITQAVPTLRYADELDKPPEARFAGMVMAALELERDTGAPTPEALQLFFESLVRDRNGLLSGHAPESVWHQKLTLLDRLKHDLSRYTITEPEKRLVLYHLAKLYAEAEPAARRKLEQSLTWQLKLFSWPSYAMNTGTLERDARQSSLWHGIDPANVDTGSSREVADAIRVWVGKRLLRVTEIERSDLSRQEQLRIIMAVLADTYDEPDDFWAGQLRNPTNDPTGWAEIPSQRDVALQYYAAHLKRRFGKNFVVMNYIESNDLLTHRSEFIHLVAQCLPVYRVSEQRRITEEIIKAAVDEEPADDAALADYWARIDDKLRVLPFCRARDPASIP